MRHFLVCNSVFGLSDYKRYTLYSMGSKWDTMPRSQTSLVVPHYTNWKTLRLKDKTDIETFYEETVILLNTPSF